MGGGGGCGGVAIGVGAGGMWGQTKPYLFTGANMKPSVCGGVWFGGLETDGLIFAGGWGRGWVWRGGSGVGCGRDVVGWLGWSG